MRAWLHRRSSVVIALLVIAVLVGIVGVSHRSITSLAAPLGQSSQTNPISMSVLQVTGSVAGGSITVTSAGKYSLVFDAAHKWQASAWYHLGSEPSTNLARSDGPSLNYNVLQSPLELAYDKWYNLDNAESATMHIVEATPKHVTLETGWTWRTADNSTFVMTTTHEIDGGRSGDVWYVHTIVTNLTNAPRTFGALEYAFTNLNPAMNWQGHPLDNQRTLTFSRQDGLTPHPTFLLMRSPSADGIDTDGTANRYWTAGPVTLQPNEQWERRWVNIIQAPVTTTPVPVPTSAPYPGPQTPTPAEAPASQAPQRAITSAAVPNEPPDPTPRPPIAPCRNTVPATTPSVPVSGRFRTYLPLTQGGSKISQRGYDAPTAT